ncbi:MAG: radical SAM protein [Candidatus Yanofskybacteria bacterium]|nr:radical SAM protein [Candidatus Yanofskybacteria bacterium]
MNHSNPFDFTKKIFFHPEQIVKYKQGERPFPVTMEIDLTNNCNHKCVWCYDLDKHVQSASEFLNTAVIKERLKEAYGLGTRGLNFSGGGEPMLHKDFLDILRFAKDMGFDLGLITNGSAIHSKNVQSLSELLTWVRISMAGGDRASYRDIQGVDQFDMVIEKIRLLSQIKKRMRTKLVIGIRVLVLEKNLHSLENMAGILKDMEINYLQLAPDQFSTDGGAFWNSSENQKTQETVREILKERGIALLGAGFSVVQDNLNYPRTCYAHFFQAVITAKGELRFCKNARGDDNYILGNINEQTLKEIWNSDKNKEIESWVRPDNCGLFCKNMALNTTMEDILYPPAEIARNFVN